MDDTRGLKKSDIAALVYLTVLLVSAIGYLNNIFWLIRHADSWQSGTWILGAIGIFVAPLGALMGLIP